MSGGTTGRARFWIVVLPLVAVVALVGAIAWPGAEEPPAPRRHLVEIRGFEYQPASLSLAEGDTVVWVNRDLVPHTATAADGGWDSGTIAAGGSWSRTFSTVGAGLYSCTFHAGMIARLRVAPRAP